MNCTPVQSPRWRRFASAPCFRNSVPHFIKGAMMQNPTRKLRVVEATGLEHTVDAPPVLVASSHTIDFLCGNCGTVSTARNAGPATQPSTDEEWRHPPEE